MVGGLHGVGAVDHVAADLAGDTVLGLAATQHRDTDLDAVVPPDGARLAVPGVGLAEHHAAGLDHALALPAHGHHGPAVHVLHQPGEEGPLAQVRVVLLQVAAAGPHHPDGHQLEALLLEPLDDVAHEAALDPVGLDHDEGPLPPRLLGQQRGGSQEAGLLLDSGEDRRDLLHLDPLLGQTPCHEAGPCSRHTCQHSGTFHGEASHGLKTVEAGNNTQFKYLNFFASSYHVKNPV